AVFCFSMLAQTGANRLPAFKPQPTVRAVFDEHVDALNHCDWSRLMAQYPPDVEIFLPGGQIVKGREKVGELFGDIVKTLPQGGICGVKFESEHAFLVG